MRTRLLVVQVHFVERGDLERGELVALQHQPQECGPCVVCTRLLVVYFIEHGELVALQHQPQECSVDHV
jgi:hypothetical protein